jgi:hypothetical protein
MSCFEPTAAQAEAPLTAEAKPEPTSLASLDGPNGPPIWRNQPACASRPGPVTSFRLVLANRQDDLATAKVATTGFLASVRQSLQVGCS